METRILGQTSSILHNFNLPSTQPQDKVKGGLFLDIVVGESSTILQLLPGKDQPLLVRRDPLLILKFNNDDSELAVKRPCT